MSVIKILKKLYMFLIFNHLIFIKFIINLFRIFGPI